MWKVICFLSLSFSWKMEVINAQSFSKRPDWIEDFRGKGKPSENNWTFYKGTFKGYSEYYTDSVENVFLKGGKLHIRAIANRKDNRICSSGRIHTLGKVSFLYGKIEIKAKIPIGKGIFPALWMLRTDHAKVYPYGEIDIMEYIGCFGKKQYQANVHIVEKKNDKEFRHMHAKKVYADMTQYHVYTLEWYKNRLVFLLDGKEVHRLEEKQMNNWPFNVPYYLIMNVAFGGRWGSSCGLDEKILPCEMCIDWIKYYKLKESFIDLD